MFINNYANSVTTFSPEGKILQIEYAQRASSQGFSYKIYKSMNILGIFSTKKKNEQLNSKNNRFFTLNSNILATFTGVLIDGQIIFKSLQNQVNEYESINNRSCPLSKVIDILISLVTKNNFHAGGRPFGINFLIGGNDGFSLKLYEISNDGITRSIQYGNDQSSTKTGYSKNNNNKNRDVSRSVDEILFQQFSFLRNTENPSVENYLSSEQIFIIGKDVKMTIFNIFLKKFYKNLDLCHNKP
mmetsp:Transcript_43127/g.67554  ORF Transcript_43127/g.67554 Transcript_43127/m.67554 type:complete len:243 (+) Transcript_43127:1419-2147(+)